MPWRAADAVKHLVPLVLFAALVAVAADRVEAVAQKTPSTPIPTEEPEPEPTAEDVVALAVDRAELQARTVEMGRASRRSEPREVPAQTRWHLLRRLECQTPVCAENHLERLRHLGPDAGPVLATLATGTDLPLAVEAVRVIGLLRLGEIDALSILLQHDAPMVRNATATALGWIASSESAAPLIERYDQMESGDDRNRVLAAIGRIPGAETRAVLREAALGGTMDEAHKAVTALEARGDRVALKQAASRSPWRPVRLQARRALRR